MNVIYEKARGKVNLFLDVLNKREDGYHNLGTIFCNVEACDELTFVKKSTAGITLVGTDGITGDKKSNLIYKAVKLLLEKSDSLGQGIEVTLKKTLPMGAGMGGGSADAAAALRGVNKLLNLKYSTEELEGFSVYLGADVPFMVKGGLAFGEGIGEQLESISEIWTELGEYDVFIATPKCFVGTPEAFCGLKPSGSTRWLDFKKSTKQNSGQWLDAMYNKFEETVFQAHPIIEEEKAYLLTLGASKVMLSGSGASLFALFKKGESVSKKMIDTSRYRYSIWTQFSQNKEK